MGKIKVITSNVHGLKEHNKRRDLFYYFHKKKFDIVLLQETHSEQKTEKIWSTQWGRKIWFSHGSPTARGVAILFAKNFQVTVHNVIQDSNGRYIVLYVSIEGKKFLISNIYAPNIDDPTFFENWFTDVKRFTPEFVLLGGDFNLVLDLSCDKDGGRQITHLQANEVVKKYIQALDLTDIWRNCNPDKFEYMWRRLHPSPVFVCLDFFLISSTLVQFVENCVITPGIKTDHSAVILELNLSTTQRGPGYWKFNTSLLQDEEYVKGMNTLLDIELDQEYKSKKEIWEIIKMTARGSTIQYAAQKKKAKKNELLACESKSKSLQNKLTNLPMSLINSTETQLQKVQHQIGELLTEKAKGAVIRSRSKWQFQADRPSKYFLNLEKYNYAKKQYID